MTKYILSILIILGVCLTSCDKTYSIYMVNDTGANVTVAIKHVLLLTSDQNSNLKRDTICSQVFFKLATNDSLYLERAIAEVENDLPNTKILW